MAAGGREASHFYCKINQKRTELVVVGNPTISISKAELSGCDRHTKAAHYHRHFVPAGSQDHVHHGKSVCSGGRGANFAWFHRCSCEHLHANEALCWPSYISVSERLHNSGEDV